MTTIKEKLNPSEGLRAVDEDITLDPEIYATKVLTSQDTC